MVYRLAVILFTDRVADYKKALLYSKEQLNLAPKVMDKRNIENSQLYLVNAFVYLKLATESRYETNRIAMKTNAFDNLKIAIDVVSSDTARRKQLLGKTSQRIATT